MEYDQEDDMAGKVTPLNIKDPEAYRMARELAEKTGESMTEAVKKALQQRLVREERRKPDPVMIEKLREISDRCARRPVLDSRSDEDIIGYDEYDTLTVIGTEERVRN